MKILCTKTYEQELKKILTDIAQVDDKEAQRFKTYLDTIIINIPTKVDKYKKSIYFYDDNVKDIEYEEYTIIFYYDEFQNNYLVLNILKKGDL
jgi:hypothetical protein